MATAGNGMTAGREALHGSPMLIERPGEALRHRGRYGTDFALMLDNAELAGIAAHGQRRGGGEYAALRNASCICGAGLDGNTPRGQALVSPEGNSFA
jgi:hypothetical protein